MSAATTTAGLRTTFVLVLGGLALGLVLLGVLFFPEGEAAVATWNASTAYGHCYLVLPMALYLIWERRQALVGIPALPQPALAVLALPIAAGWLVAERLGIMEGRQLMAIAGAELLFLVVLGWPLFRALLGPLLFLVFLVPFGAFLTPALQHFTARFSILGLNLLGIPNYSDGLIIEIPAGTFYVAEACAGLRFLIASVAFGVFYALLNYRSPGRRAAFIAASIVVPIIANGFRALGIVVLGHILGSAEAAAADHVIYGWVFFSIVMMLLVVAGLPLREAPAPAPAGVRPGPLPRTGLSPVLGALGVGLLVASGPASARFLDRQATPVPMQALPNLVMPEGCVRTGAAPTLPATRVALTVDCGGQIWNLAIETFPARSTAAALIAERRRATGELQAEDRDYAPLPLSRADNGSWTVVQTYQPFRTTAVASWVDGAPALGGVAGRLRQARDSVLGGDHAAVLMVIGTSVDGRLPPGEQRVLMTSLRHFIEAQAGLTAQIASLSKTMKTAR